MNPLDVTSLGHPPDFGSFAAAEVPMIHPSTADQLDRAVAEVAAHRHAWLSVDVLARAALLERTIDSTFAIAAEWVAEDLRVRHIPPDAPYVGIEWLLGPAFVIRNLRSLRDTLLEIARLGRPRVPGPIRTRGDGTLTAGIYPRHPVDRVLLPGYSAEVWMQKGVTEQNFEAHVGMVYRPEAERRPSVCAVLGAGNITALGPNDVLYKLIAEDRVVVFKVSPALDYHVPYLERAFAPFIEAGFLRIVSGGAEEARHLAHHPDVDTIQLTGSDKTYEALVFGSDADAQRRKAADQPILDKWIDAECGVVPPIVIVPGNWSAREIEIQAENIVSPFLINAALTCVTPRVLITDRRWDRRDELLAAIRHVLAKSPTRFPFHPGALDRMESFLDDHPDAERLGDAKGDRAPWVFAAGLDPDDLHETAFRVDPFCGVLSETALDGCDTPADFIRAATAFCNNRLWGTLNGSLFVHPKSLRDRSTAAAFDRALAELRYGNIVVNAGPGLPYLLTIPPWGAYPGNTRTNIGSGVGVVHNTLLLENTVKTVSRAPFHPMPKPPWLVTNRHQREIFEALTAWEARQSAGDLLRVLWNGVLG